MSDAAQYVPFAGFSMSMFVFSVFVALICTSRVFFINHGCYYSSVASSHAATVACDIHLNSQSPISFEVEILLIYSFLKERLTLILPITLLVSNAMTKLSSGARSSICSEYI